MAYACFRARYAITQTSNTAESLSHVSTSVKQNYGQIAQISAIYVSNHTVSTITSTGDSAYSIKLVPLYILSFLRIIPYFFSFLDHVLLLNQEHANKSSYNKQSYKHNKNWHVHCQRTIKRKQYVFKTVVVIFFEEYWQAHPHSIVKSCYEENSEFN